jgi:hypothetical protein
MAQLKDQQAGTDADNFTVGGALSVAGTSTLTGAVSAPAGVTGNLTGNVTGNLTGNVTAVDITSTGNTILGNASTDTLNVGNGGLVKDASGNVGIGTASPATSLQIGSTTRGSDAVVYTATLGGAYKAGLSYEVAGLGAGFIGENDSGSTYLGIPTATAGFSTTNTRPIVIATNSLERMRIDANGNVGVGITPSAWSSLYKMIVIGNSGAYSSLWGSSNTDGGTNSYGQSGIGNNIAAGDTYAGNGAASYALQSGGRHTWFTAPNGTAGNPITFTERMRIDASGNVNIAGLTASQAVATDASKNLVSVANTGTGNNVLATSPTFTGVPLAPTAAAGTSTTQLATTAFATTAIQALHPVGSIYTSTVATNPNTLFGFGTWVAFGAGRVMVGVGGAFSAGATGGSADAVVVSHTHSATFTGNALPTHSHQLFSTGGGGTSAFSKVTVGGAEQNVPVTSAVSGGTPTGTITNASTGVSGTDANLQPYIVVYMWNRTA